MNPESSENSAKPNRLRVFIWSALAVFYIVVSFGFNERLRELGPHASHLFGATCVLFVSFLYGRNVFLIFSPDAASFKLVPLSFVAGFAVFKVALQAGLPVPIDTSNYLVLLSLLFISPVLEEMVFRFFLWKPAEWIFKSRLVALILTSVIFSLAHLWAIRYTPEVMHSFFKYQAFYTLLTGAGCGYFVYRSNSLSGAVAFHFLFNLGFFVAALV